MIKQIFEELFQPISANDLFEREEPLYKVFDQFVSDVEASPHAAYQIYKKYVADAYEWPIQLWRAAVSYWGVKKADKLFGFRAGRSGEGGQPFVNRYKEWKARQ